MIRYLYNPRVRRVIMWMNVGMAYESAGAGLAAAWWGEWQGGTPLYYALRSLLSMAVAWVLTREVTPPTISPPK